MLAPTRDTATQSRRGRHRPRRAGHPNAAGPATPEPR